MQENEEKKLRDSGDEGRRAETESAAARGQRRERKPHGLHRSIGTGRSLELSERRTQGDHGDRFMIARDGRIKQPVPVIANPPP